MLTPTQEAQIRLYLGYADQFRYQDTRLESILGSLSDEAEVQIAIILAALSQVEAAILDFGINGVGLKRVDEIWFDNESGQSRASGLKNSGRRYINQLSILLGVPIFGDYYGSGGWPGDSFSEGGVGSVNGRFYPVG